MPIRRKEKLRRSVSLEPDAEVTVEWIAEAKGVSVNRAIEKAVTFYSLWLKAQDRHQGEIIGLVIQSPGAQAKTVEFITS